MMKNFRQLAHNLFPSDYIVIVFYLLLSIVNLIFSSRLEYPIEFIIYNFAFIAFVLLIAHKDKNGKNTVWNQLHYWYLVPFVFFTFKEIYWMVKPIRGVDYDNILINADRFIFGGDPTIYLHSLSAPLLTEILQIVYATFFFLPVILTLEFMITNRYIELKYSIFIILFGFILSYIGYFILPAVGPRFTLHEFSKTSIELPGLWATEFLREVVNSGESIPAGTVNPIEVVQRDVFPSGHTQMTLLVMWLSLKFKMKTKYFFVINGSLLVFSTVYLRYHYVTDLIGGFVFMLITILLGNLIFDYWKNKMGIADEVN